MIIKSIQKIFGQTANKSLEFTKTLNAINNNRSVNLTGLTGSARSFFISCLINMLNRPILLLTPDISTALKYNKDIKLFTEKKVLFLPSQEVSPYEQVYADPEITKQQLESLENFKNGKASVIITPGKNLLNSFLSTKNTDTNSLNISLKQKSDTVEMAEKLVNLGYKRTTMVVDPGEFSLRGDILDIFPISGEPVRIKFFCDEIESLKIFNIDTQRSIKVINSLKIEPRYKILINDSKKQEFIEKLTDLKNKQVINLEKDAAVTLMENIDNFIEMFSADTYTEGIEYFAPLINEETSDISDFLPENTLIISHESLELMQRLYVQDEKFIKEYEKNIKEGLALQLPCLLHKRPDEIIEKLHKYPALKLDSFVSEDTETLEEVEQTAVPKFMADLCRAEDFISSLRQRNYKVFIITEYPQRVTESLKDLECPCINLDEESISTEKLALTNDVIVFNIGFDEGFVLPEINLAVITDAELFNKKIKKPTLGKKISKKENIDYLVSVNDLKEGDFIVHSKHGIGRFIGLSKQELDGQEKDYLTIEYAKADKLHMPAEQINFLSRYRGSSTPPKLSKMGGVDWTGVKRKVKKAIEEIAEDLLTLYAKRAKTIGYSFEEDTAWQIEMENAFPYNETPDQMQAIIDTKKDMESEKVLDRLICGDVGFGKTEVALRAVFKAVLSGKQAAILVPTTILAQQHFMTFSERFKPYPVKIELMSRFRTAKEQRETVKKLITGEVDLVIGTHRLLQKDIQFKNLGLLVIDEEHRFGVTHKEKIKKLKSEVDVLTMSATPIPRTLHMALSGLREMSIINTPPVNRAPIKTYVGNYNESLIRTAIMHELEREGQIYLLHNKVQSIYRVADEIQKLVPEARIAIGHGQMKEKELEKIMTDFAAHEYDILISTTIIESGLDIPNANTIIIDDADKFGLAQLYQIRGRVGRSETQAYAYCLYRPNKLLTAEAKDRLKAIKDFTTLGSGYQIALRDLEIRGVGNLLGSQQHGHMLSVGFDLYCQLLEESIKELKGEKVEKKEPTIIDINITAFIPDEWIGGKEQKMIEYKRLADVLSLKELEVLEDEWIDRFGNIPEEVSKLIQIIRLRLLATEIGVNLVRETFDKIRIFTDYSFAEWRLLQSKMDSKLARKMKWIKAPATSDNGSSIIELDISRMFNDDKLNALDELFHFIANFKVKALEQNVTN